MTDVFENVIDNTEPRFKKLGVPDKKDVFGDRFLLQDFVECNEDGGILDDDGLIGEILVDGELTNINVPGWMLGFNDDEVDMNFDELQLLDEEVTIVWYNK